MNKKPIAILCLIFFSALATVSATSVDVAYILKDNSQINGNILDSINQLGLSYEIVRDNQIQFTDFSRYAILLIAENVDDKESIPYNQKHALFFDKAVAQKVWSGVQTGVSSNGKFVAVSDPTHEIFEGISLPADRVITAYGGSGYEMHYLNAKPSYVKTLAIKTPYNLPVIAYSSRDISGSLIKDVFMGLPEPEGWAEDSKKIFRNSLMFLLEDIDQDGDGWPSRDDCNDQNNLTYPGAPEIPYDLIDQDCNGLDLLDADGDGYCASGYLIQNSLLQCFLDTGISGTDCDDDDAFVNPSNPDPLSNCMNDAPQISRITVQPQPINEGDVVTIEVTAIDPEDDTLTYEINDSRFTRNGNIFSWQTSYYDAREHIFLIEVSDSEFSVSQLVSLQIANKNVPPTSITIPQVEWPEDSEHLINLSEYFYDGDSEDLEFGIEELPNETNIGILFETNELVRLVPAPDFFGEEHMVFYADDGSEKTFSNKVTLVVTNVNDPVTFSGQITDIGMNEDTHLEQVLNLYDYFSDIDSELQFEAIGNNSLTINIENGLVSISPEKDYFGTDEVYFIATDDEFSANSNAFTITVNEMGEPPVFEDLECETEIEEDLPYVCSLQAFDFENDTMIFSVSSENHLSCEISDNVLTYVSEKNYNGFASCELSVSDMDGTDTQTLEVNVTPVNDAPAITSYTPQEQTVKIVEGTSKTFSVTVEDPDSDFVTSWFLSGVEVTDSTASTSQFVFNGSSRGNYILKALTADQEFEVNKLWTLIVGPITDFTCEEVSGHICTEDQLCGSSLLGVKDSEVCCATSCIPAFKDADACEISDENVAVEIVSPDANDEIKLGDTIKVELKLWNYLEEDKDFDVELHIYNLDRDRSEVEVNANAEIKAGKYRTFRLDLEIPEDLNLENNYVIFAKASDKICNQNYSEIDINRLEKKVILSDFEIPENALCGDTVKAVVRSENIGTKDQEVKIKLENSKLKLSEESDIFTLEKYGKENEEKTELSFKLPDKIESGKYTIKAVLTYGTEMVVVDKNLNIECVSEIVSTSNVAPDEISSKITLNQVQGQEAQSNGKDTNYNMLVLGTLMMFNLVLVASIALLYVVGKKKSGNLNEVRSR